MQHASAGFRIDSGATAGTLTSVSSLEQIMQNRKKDEWIWPPIDHWVMVWGMFVIALIAILQAVLLSFISSPTGAIWCYITALGVAALGVSLIAYAKLPLYRQRRFLTFGTRPLPGGRRSFYRWGYCCVAVAVALLFCLMWAKKLIGVAGSH